MRYFFCLLFIAFIAGCGNYTSSTRKARDDFYAGKFSDSAKELEEGAHKEGVNQVLYLMDRATALHHAADYTESNKDFHLLDKLTEIKDYTSLSQEALTMVSNDKIIPYKGEEFEKVLISQYLALNYLYLGMPEDALVECRRVNHKLHLLASVAKRKIELSPMAYYLSAMMYEDQGEWDDAYVDYQNVYDLKPDLSYLRDDLFRLAWKTKNIQDMEKWTVQFALTADEKKRIKEESIKPEVIAILEVGYSPEKGPNPAWHALPKYFPLSYPVVTAELNVNDKPVSVSQEMYNIEAVAIQNLDDKFAGLIAKRVAGVVAKEVISDQIGKHTDPVIGLIAKIGMYAADQADLRSWRTLPKNFQVVRVRLPIETDGPVKLVFKPKGPGNTNASSVFGTSEKTVQLSPTRPKGKVFVSVRI